MTLARDAADVQASPAHHQPVAVVLDLVNSLPDGGRSVLDGEHGATKTEGKTMTREVPGA